VIRLHQALFLSCQRAKMLMRLKTLFCAFVWNFLMFALRCWVVVAVVPLAMFVRSPGWISVGTSMVLSSFRFMHKSCSVACALFLFALVAVWFKPRASASAEPSVGVVVF
jgi:hypothetical protein